MENIKPTLSKPISTMSLKIDNQFKQNNFKQLDEVDNLLNEKEQSLKKKIFSLPKMEALTFSDPKLSNLYDSMAESGSERYGYHYNETILNLIFNDYVLNSSKYLQKYKMAIPIEKKRRDKSGINKLKHDGELKMHPTGTKITQSKNESMVGTAIEETTTAGSAGSAAGYVGYATPSAWAKSGKPMANKPMIPNGIVINESVKNDYLTNPKIFNVLFEEFNRNEVIDNISKNSDEFGTETNKMSDADLNIINNDIKNKTIGVSTVGTVQEVIDEYDYTDSRTKQDDLTSDEVVAKHMESLKNIANRCLNITQMCAVLKVFINNNDIMDTNDTIAIIKAAGKLFKEKSNNIDEGVAINDRKIEKIVQFINSLIAQAVDRDGDPIPVVDNTQTWEQPYVYSPIEYKNGRLKIVSTKSPNYRNEPSDVDVISKPNMEYDGIPTLRLISRMYKKAIKNIDKYNANLDVNNDDLDDEGNQLREESQTMIADNPTSMKMQAPQGTQTSGMDVGMNAASSGAGMSENINLNKNTKDMAKVEYNEYDEMLSELEEISALHENLKVIAEDRKTSSLVLVDRLGKDNAKNFKSDLQHSGTKETIDVEKELEYKDQQTDVDKNPYKTAEDIEKASTKESFKNVGNSTNLKGDEIPKRNMTEEEQEQVNNYKLGLGDVAFDGEVGERYEERMKNDMGEDRYKQRQENLKTRAEMPMYNKDSQPTVSKGMESKYEKNLAEAVMITGRYSDILNKSHMFDFMLNETIVSKDVNENWYLIKVDGLGNTYANKLNENTSKLDVNENISNIIESYKFYLGENKTVFAVENSKIINESVMVKTNTNDLNKMKHLLGYNPKNFVETSKNKRV